MDRKRSVVLMVDIFTSLKVLITIISLNYFLM